MNNILFIKINQVPHVSTYIFAVFSINQSFFSQINVGILEAIDRECLDIMPALSFIDTDHSKYEEVQFQWTKANRLAVYEGEHIPIIHHSTSSSQVIDMPKELKLELDDMVHEKEEAKSAEQQDLEQSISIVKDDGESDYFDNDDNNHSDHSEEIAPPVKVPPKVKKKAVNKLEADGSSLDEEYASMVVITDQEAQAAVDVYRLFSHGTFRCQVCNKGYHTEQRLTAHLRMHDQVRNNISSSRTMFHRWPWISSQNDRAWPIVPTWAQCRWTSHIPLNYNIGL